MKITLTDLRDQRGRQTFSEDIELDLPTQPYIKNQQDFRGPFYGQSGKLRIMDYKELLKKGYCVISIVWAWDPPMFKGQKEYFKIIPKNKVKDGMIILQRLPSSLYLNHKVVEAEVRLEGKGAGYARHGNWIKLTEVN